MTSMNNLEVFINGIRYVPAQDTTPRVDYAFFFNSIRASLFKGSLNQAQVEGCELLIETCTRFGLSPLIEQTAYVLATAYHETAFTMKPIEEYGGKNKPYAPWYGRGFVQLTWESNYQKMQNLLENLPYVKENNIPYEIHADPKLALQPKTSTLICVLGMKDGVFTGKKLTDYINSSVIDYFDARRIVNGTDKAGTIAKYATLFTNALKSS